MAQLFVPIQGAFKALTGLGFNPHGESLERPEWRGAEIGLLDTFPDVWGAVSEAEFHDWIIGVHHPLYKEGGPEWCRFFDRDPAVRAHALDQAASAAQGAHHVGARYILMHFPWPGFQLEGRDLRAEGWYFSMPLQENAQWSRDEVYEVSKAAFERFAQIQETEKIKVVLEIDGPNPYFFEDDLYPRLFEQYPDLSLCVDTGRLGLLARTHGRNPVEMLKPWLPWTRHLHLSTSLWDEQGKFHNHIPTNRTHTVDKWPNITPAADLARMVVEAQPRAIVVLEHNPKAVSPQELEEAHAWAAELVGAGL